MPGPLGYDFGRKGGDVLNLERYLLVSFAMDGALCAVAARACGALRWRRVIPAAALAALYGALAAARPRPWGSPAIQLVLLVPLSMLLCASASPRRFPLAALTLLCGAMLCGGAAALLRGGFAAALPGAGLLLMLLGARRRLRGGWQVEVALRMNGRTRRFTALIDTGNRLREPFSGLPVLIAEERLLRGLLPERGYRPVAYAALGGGGTLRCFRPEGMWIITPKGPRPAPPVWVAPLPRPLPSSVRALAPGEFALAD